MGHRPLFLGKTSISDRLLVAGIELPFPSALSPMFRRFFRALRAVAPVQSNPGAWGGISPDWMRGDTTP
jgi:hypothetical protein